MYVLNEKTGFWSIPKDTRELKINCYLSPHGAMKLVKEYDLERIIIPGAAYNQLEDDVKALLEENTRVELTPSMENLPRSDIKELQHKHASGVHTLESLAKEYGLDKKDVQQYIRKGIR